MQKYLYCNIFIYFFWKNKQNVFFFCENIINMKHDDSSILQQTKILQQHLKKEHKALIDFTNALNKAVEGIDRINTLQPVEKYNLEDYGNRAMRRKNKKRLK